MLLQLIRVKVDGRLLSFKTADDLERNLKVELSVEDENKLLECSLTNEFACVKIQGSQLTITGIDSL